MKVYYSIPRCNPNPQKKMFLLNLVPPAEPVIINSPQDGIVTTEGHEDTSSHSIRDDTLFSILIEIRQLHPNNSTNFASVLFAKTVDVTVKHICPNNSPIANVLLNHQRLVRLLQILWDLWKNQLFHKIMLTSSHQLFHHPLLNLNTLKVDRSCAGSMSAPQKLNN